MDTDGQPMSKAEADLKTTAEDIAADAARVREIELRKTTLDAEDPRMAALSRESAELTEGMAQKAQLESAIADEAASTSG